MTEIIGIILVILGITIFSCFIAYVIGDFESIKELITIAVILVAVGYYLITWGE